MDSGLKLLMHDGLVRCAFSPLLTSDQYDELTGIVQRLSPAGTAGDLVRDLKAAAERWGVTAVFSRDRE